MKENTIKIKSSSNGKQVKKDVKTKIKSESKTKLTLEITSDVDGIRLFMDWLDSIDIVEVKKAISTKMT